MLQLVLGDTEVAEEMIQRVGLTVVDETANNGAFILPLAHGKGTALTALGPTTRLQCHERIALGVQLVEQRVQILGGKVVAHHVVVAEDKLLPEALVLHEGAHYGAADRAAVKPSEEIRIF